MVRRLRSVGCVFAEDEAALLITEATTAAKLSSMLERRVGGLPLEHVLGWAEFCGLRIAVDPGVFVPRRRTELLVRRAVAHAAPGPVVVDLACGSGAVGVAIVTAIGPATLHAVDLEPAAVRCARRNVEPIGGHVSQGDLFEPLPATLRGRVDILSANVPYVPTEAVGLLPPEARLHEPLIALDGGRDGLDVLRRVAEAAPGWLAPGGQVLMEIGEHQSPGACAALTAAGLVAATIHDDELGATIVTGRRST